MNTKDLMARCQEYYGMQYSPGMGAIVIQYLDKVPDKIKPHLFAEVVKSHSVSFKALPDVSIFEGVHDMAWADFHADNPPPSRPQLPPPSERATDEDIEAFLKDMESRLSPAALVSFKRVMAKWTKGGR
jgi:hypothetical protein